MYHLTQSKTGTSSLELARRLGVTPNTAWKLKHKLLQVMLEREEDKPLNGRVEMDDAHLGGERSGGKRGRGAPGKTPFIAAVETTEQGKPVRIKLRRVKGFRRKEVEKFAKKSLTPGSMLNMLSRTRRAATLASCFVLFRQACSVLAKLLS